LIILFIGDDYPVTEAMGIPMKTKLRLEVLRMAPLIKSAPHGVDMWRSLSGAVVGKMSLSFHVFLKIC